MKIRVTRPRLLAFQLPLRYPLRVPGGPVTSVTQVALRLEVELNNRGFYGLAAETLAPGRMDPRSGHPAAEQVRDLARVVEQACRLALEVRATSPYDFWRQHLDAMRAWGDREKLPPLAVHLGVSLVERALLDAVARRVNRPLYTLLLDARDNPLGADWGAFYRVLRERTPIEFLPLRPYQTVQLQHPIQPEDPLTAADLPEGGRGSASVPLAPLDKLVADLGLRSFKIVLPEDPEAQLGRVVAVAEVLQRVAPPDYNFSFEALERFSTPSEFFHFWSDVRSHPALDDFIRRLRAIEQPFRREVALRENIGNYFRGWPSQVPVILDESNVEPGSFLAASELGYTGLVHHSSQGFFKGVADAMLLRFLRDDVPTRRWTMLAGDFLSTGPLGMGQDLASAATLGLEQVERHHHKLCDGLWVYPLALADAAATGMPELYERSGSLQPRLLVRRGRLQLANLFQSPFAAPEEFSPALFGESPPEA